MTDADFRILSSLSTGPLLASVLASRGCCLADLPGLVASGVIVAGCVGDELFYRLTDIGSGLHARECRRRAGKSRNGCTEFGLLRPVRKREDEVPDDKRKCGKATVVSYECRCLCGKPRTATYTQLRLGYVAACRACERRIKSVKRA